MIGYGKTPDRLGYGRMEILVANRSGDIIWRAETRGDRAEHLQVQDINGDGRSEVLSVESMGASGETLYVLVWWNQVFGWLKPQGGYFEGQDSFGENSVQVRDVDEDGRSEILAGYGPSALQTDVYKWDGAVYAFVKTIAQ